MSSIESVDPIDRHVGMRLRVLRIAAKLTQDNVADRLRLSCQQVEKYENGASRISASKLFELAHLLNVPVGAFFEGLAPPRGSASTAPLVDAPLIHPHRLTQS